MSKKNKTLLAIFTESIGLYFSNFDKFVKYMTFPVLGQLLGLSIILTLSFFYANNIPNIITKIPEFNNLWLLITIAILITLPGFIIFIKASIILSSRTFWWTATIVWYWSFIFNRCNF